MANGQGRGKKVFMLGMGDVGMRLAQQLAERGIAAELQLAGRGASNVQWARLLDLGNDCRVSSVTVDGNDEAGLGAALAAFEPDMIVQCATRIAPFEFAQFTSPRGRAVIQAGFAIQTAAQLPIILALMRARRAVGLACPVMNCSFPDLTNPLLARLDAALAPTVGVGNVAILAKFYEAALGGRHRGRIRVIAHHPQLTSLIRGELPRPDLPLPLVYADTIRLPDAELKIDPGVRLGSTLNYLVALTALPVIRGLLDASLIVHTHAPGVLGLEGGYPILIRDGGIELDLPPGVTREEAIAFNLLSGRADAIERLERDGTVVYTEAARAAMAPHCAELAEPLDPRRVEERYAVLDAYRRSC